MFAYNCLTFTFLSAIGLLFYYDTQNIIIPYIPKIYQSETVPMVLVKGNWTCQSSVATYKNYKKTSQMSPDSSWWKDCAPLTDNKCDVISTWMGEEYNSEGILEKNRYVKYWKEKLKNVKQYVLNGESSTPRYLTLNEIQNKIKFKSNERKFLRNDQCMAQFTFRNVLTGEYLIESSYHPQVLTSWMKRVGELFQVTFLEPCLFNKYWNTNQINNQYHCIIDLLPMNMTSYNLIQSFKQ